MTKKQSKKLRPEFWLKVFLLVIALMAAVKLMVIHGTPADNVIDVDGAGDNRITFANCLMNRGMIMYGVDTCEYCQMQKKMFGRAFEKIPYVNCDFEKICREKGITRYPVWELENRLIPGVQSFDQLAGISGCKIPNKISN